LKYILIISFAILSLTSIGLSAEPHLVYLAAKSKLMTIRNNKEIITDTSKLVYALEENPNDRKQYWIYNNKKEKIYLTSALNITEMENDYNLFQYEKSNKVYAATQDTKMPFESAFNVHLEQVSMSDFSALYSAQTNTATATRYEFRTLYHTPMPICFGFNLNFQNIYWANGDEQIRLTLLSVGPSFSYKILKSDFLSLSMLGSAEIAPLAQSTSVLYNEKFSAYSFDAGFEGEVSNPYGIFTFGTHLRQYLLLLKNTSRPNLTPNSSEYKLTSIGLSIGYKVEWEL
jgi:hypothetical protein